MAPSGQTARSGIPWPQQFRQATLILPRTGERVKRNFTLRDPQIYGQPQVDDSSNDEDDSDNDDYDDDDDVFNERAALLPSSSRRAPKTHGTASYFRHLSRKSRLLGARVWAEITSPVGQGVLKCALAYLLGSLATFVAPIAATLGQQDGKHMVATITVYFHPARSSGSMHQATIFAMLAFVYTVVIAFTSMGVSIFFASRDLLALGHVIVLLAFCGVGLGFIGWLKQSLGHPLVGVTCSLASLAIVQILTREGVVQDGVFSAEKVNQVLKMVIMGIFITTAVNLLVKPISARHELRNSLNKATDAMSIMLAAITHGFLSGSNSDMDHPIVTAASAQFKAAYGKLTAHLMEAKSEHYLLGTERQYHIEARLVGCIQLLAQDLGGLRSAAAMQMSLLADLPISQPPSQPFTPRTNPRLPPPETGAFYLDDEEYQRRRLSDIPELIESPSSISRGDMIANAALELPIPTPLSQRSFSQLFATGPVEVFSIFLINLGPPMKSLAYTIKQILDDLPLDPHGKESANINRTFKRSLVEAIDLFSRSRREALASVYQSKTANSSRPMEVVADFEEVATSCGYFSASLQDFAEDISTYLDVSGELDREIAERPDGRTWQWLRFWSRWWYNRRHKLETVHPPPVHDFEERHIDQDLPRLKKSRTHKPSQWQKPRTYLSRARRYLLLLRRTDVRFAVKVGAGAAFWAMFSFIPETKPVYSHWRLEWGLLSYMVVCSTTVGASNTTGISRIFGTCIGALLAVVAWIVSDANALLLALIGTLVSLPCFYLIVGKGQGPMGRFILLTYNLSCLYAYSLSVRDEENDDDEGGVNPLIWEIVLHRLVAVTLGCLWAMVITQIIWPASARKKLKEGLSLLWLRMGLMWKRDPLLLLAGHMSNATQDPYMDLREETRLRAFLTRLETWNKSANLEFSLRGKFPADVYSRLLAGTSRMLDSFHALNVLITKDLKASPGERLMLDFMAEETQQLSLRISHLFSVLASSIKLEYSLNDALPRIENARDRLLARLFEFRQSHNHVQGSGSRSESFGGPGSSSDQSTAAGQTGPVPVSVTPEDYELLYAYALVTGQISKEIFSLSAQIDELYGHLDEDLLQLQ